MGITYKKLWKLLIDKNMNKGYLHKAAGISPSSIAKISKGENIQPDLLMRICNALGCDISDIIEIDRDKREDK
jgi:DNA-binding Xre family transcriptional regulator